MASNRSDEAFDPFREIGSSSAPVVAPPAPQPQVVMGQPYIPPSPQAFGGAALPSSYGTSPATGTGTAGEMYGSQAMPPSPPLKGSHFEQPGAQVPPPESGETPADTTMKFWTIEFYQPFFDVTTDLVLNRMRDSLVPTITPDYLSNRTWAGEAASIPGFSAEETENVPEGKPDLYGPFWICTTLWMLLGIVSNIMSRIEYGRNPNNVQKWKYDFTMPSVASLVIYLYCFGFGCILWGVMKFKGLPVTLLDTLCVYGYSLFVFVPITILCAIPISVVQWLLVMLGGALSTAYVLMNFGKLWKVALPNQWYVGLSALVGGLHLLITLSFKFYFLNYKF